MKAPIINLFILQFISCILFGCSGNQAKPNVDANVFGLYRYNPKEAFFSAKLKLYKNWTYKYIERGCTGSGIDTGKFEFVTDTIRFYSSVNQTAASNRQIVRRLNNEKFILKNGRIFFSNSSYNNYLKRKYAYENGVFRYYPDFLLREDLQVMFNEVLDSNGDGKAIIWKGNGEVLLDGLFKHNELVDGCTYNYFKQKPDSVKVSLYRNKRKTCDTILERY